MKRALIVTAIVAAYGVGLIWGIERGKLNPHLPPVCDFRGFNLPMKIVSTVTMLARVGETEICIRYQGVLVCETMQPDVGIFQVLPYQPENP